MLGKMCFLSINLNVSYFKLCLLSLVLLRLLLWRTQISLLAKNHPHSCWGAAPGSSHSFVSSRLTKLVLSLCPQRENSAAPTQPRGFCWTQSSLPMLFFVQNLDNPFPKLLTNAAQESSLSCQQCTPRGVTEWFPEKTTVGWAVCSSLGWFLCPFEDEWNTLCQRKRAEGIKQKNGPF